MQEMIKKNIDQFLGSIHNLDRRISTIRKQHIQNRWPYRSKRKLECQREDVWKYFVRSEASSGCFLHCQASAGKVGWGHKRFGREPYGLEWCPRVQSSIYFMKPIFLYRVVSAYRNKFEEKDEEGKFVQRFGDLTFPQFVHKIIDENEMYGQKPLSEMFSCLKYFPAGIARPTFLRLTMFTGNLFTSRIVAFVRFPLQVNILDSSIQWLILTKLYR